MARIRTIKPEFPQSEAMGRVSRDARLLFVQLWTICDDDGRTRGASRLLASLLYPYDSDAPELIDGWLAELEAVGAIRRYCIDEDTYLDIPKWLKHQKIDHPTKSKIPEFHEDSRITAKVSETVAPERDRDLDRDLDRGGSEPAEADSLPASSPSVLTFPTIGTGAKSWDLSEAQVAEWVAAYPTVDVVAECRKALEWLKASPQRRKTVSGMARFLVNWLNRETNSRRAAPPEIRGPAVAEGKRLLAYIRGESATL